jgi:hypothetical protein
VQRGPYSWWFVCWEHTEAVVVSYHGDPNDGRPKSRVKTLCTSAAGAAWAQCLYTLYMAMRKRARLRTA